MNDDVVPLKPTTISNWQIRDFPNALREQITARAAAERKHVAELVARCMAFAAEYDWASRPVDGASNSVKPSMLEIAQVVTTLAATPSKGAKSASQLGIRVIRGQLAALLPQSAPQPAGQVGRQPRVVAPEQIERHGFDVVAPENGEQSG